MPRLAALLACFFLLAAAAAAPALDQTFADGNCRFTLPAGWLRLKGNEAFTALYVKSGNALAFVFEIGDASPEACDLAAVNNIRAAVTSMGEITRDQLTVAGERAVRSVFDYDEQGTHRRMYMTNVAHQGVVYRFLGIFNGGDRERFEREVAACVDSLAFIGARPEWLARSKGVAVPQAFAGGLARCELNQPRWHDGSFEGKRQAWSGMLDEVEFTYVGGSAWLHVDVGECHGDEADLERCANRWTARLAKPAREQRTLRDGDREIPYVDTVGEFQGERHVMLVAALAKDGVRAELALECLEVQREELSADWEQALRSLAVLARDADGVAFTPRRPDGERSEDPATAALEALGARLTADDESALGFSPDGRQALLEVGSQPTLIDLTSGHRRPLELGEEEHQPVAWSADGKRIAYLAGGQVVTVALADGATTKRALAATDLAFAGDRLIAATQPFAAEMLSGARQVAAMSLVELGEGDAQTELVAFPLARFGAISASRDGKRLLFASNRGYPRTAAVGGNAWTLERGGEAQRLSSGPEDIVATCVGADGALYALRRIDPGRGGVVGAAGVTDLWRLAAGEEPRRLTACGRCARVWALGDDLALEISDWHLPPRQQGVWRLSPAELLKHAPGATEPSLGAAAQATALSQAVVAITGDPREYVPEAGSLATIAEAFAATARGRCDTALDFSAASLDALAELSTRLRVAANGRQPALTIGFGAYYGETLRRSAGAEWRLWPQRFGDWTPAAPDYRDLANGLAEEQLPFDECYREGFDSDEAPMLRSESLKRRSGQKLLLVYPGWNAAKALEEASDRDYLEAWRAADAGEIARANELMLGVIRRHPDSEALIREASALAEAAGGKQGEEVAERAIAADSIAPRVLERQADRVAASDPARAQALYRKAASQGWPDASVLLKLAKSYGADHAELERCCLRRAWRVADEAEHESITALVKAQDDAIAARATAEAQSAAKAKEPEAKPDEAAPKVEVKAAEPKPVEPTTTPEEPEPAPGVPP